MIRIRCINDIYFSIVLTFCAVAGYSQTNLKQVAHYFLPEFKKDIVLMRNGSVYDMAFPEGLDTQASIEYWLDKDGKLNKFISIRQ